MISVYNTWGSASSLKTKLFLTYLSTFLVSRPEYCPAPDYLTRSSPTYNATNTSGPVADNACCRSKYGSDLTFDFIVVGAGAAGSVIAAELSENPNWRVLLIEAGGDTVVESVPPQMAPFVVNSTSMWKYNAEVSNTSCQAYKNGCPMPCGKQLSGSTGANSMMYVCGQDRDYDEWEALGNDGWGYQYIRELIKKNEENSDLKRNPSYHGFSGKLTVSNNIYDDKFKDVVIKGFNKLGYKTLTDINDQQYNGVVDLQSTIKKGERENAYLAFIEPIKNRTNLFIVKNGLVTNILFNGTKAIGVNVKTSNLFCPANIQFKASKEVIVSAGGLNSPKILLQSGIGPKDDLTKLGIPIVFDSPGVGKNYHDHLFSSHFLKIYPNATNQTDAYLDAAGWEYLIFRTGYFSHFSTVNMNGFINATNTSSKYSDIQILFSRIDKKQLDYNVVLSNYGFKDSFVAEIEKANLEAQVVQVYTTLLNPTTRGKVELRGKDPELKPKITSNFLTNLKDVATLLGGIRKVRELVKTQEFKDINAEIIKFNISECNSIEYPSDEYEECYIKYVTTVLWHPVGTCKMGPVNDTEAVVDPTLKVYGIKGLRVADASIMPTITSGNTQCPVYAIGRKAAELIKQTWA